MMTKRRLRISVAIAAGAAAAIGAVGLSAPAGAAPVSAGATRATTGSTSGGVTVPAGFTATVFAHAGGTVSSPDDITRLGGRVFVGFQNGVGSKGEPSKTGQKASTVVEYDARGREVAHWDLTGKVDGLGADPRTHEVIATVNEDGDSSVYTIAPRGSHATVRHYHYSSLPHGGGTDNVRVRDGVVYIVASNPAPDAQGSTAGKPALYTVTFSGTTAKTTPVFDDNIVATNVVTGKAGALNLTDPDSSTFVPARVPGVGGTLLLDSQGDQELVFVRHPGAADQRASVLPLSQQVDDTAFPTASAGTLYAVDSAKNEVIAISGHFTPGEAFTSGPKALSTLNLKTGQVTPFAGGIDSPKGLMFVPATAGHRDR